VTHFAEVHHTSTIDESEELLRSRYGDINLSGHRLAMDEAVEGDNRFMVGRLRIDGSYEASADVAGLTIVTSPSGYRWRTAQEAGTGVEPAVFEPGRPMTCDVDHSVVDIVVLDPAQLTETARTLYGDDRIQIAFDGTTARSPAYARFWHRTALLAQNNPTLGNDLVRSSMYRMLAVAALESFRLKGDPKAREASSAALLAIFRKAVSYIDDSAALPITVDDIAVAAGASGHQLDRAFRAHALNGWSPTRYLKMRRLEAAHDDLTHAPHSFAGLRDVALRWGFEMNELRREHDERYGVDPGADLTI
jgi:AraC-like DNA-binding protein